jgi:hypothetical protein
MRPYFRRFAAYLAGTTRPPRVHTRAVVMMVALVAAGALASASPAVAQNDPTSAQYCEEGVLNEVTGECEEGGTAAVAAEPSGAEAGGVSGRVVGSLPFTGVDLIALGVVALALLGTGFVLRRLSAPRDL